MMRPLDPLFDQRIADWLEDDPAPTPSGILETIAAAVPSIPQRRPRRWLSRTTFSPWPRRVVWIVIVGSIVLIALAFLSGVGQPPRPDRTRATPPPPAVVVTSSPASATPRAKPSPTVSPLSGSGAIVFEHFTAGLGTRLEVLQPNGLGRALLPDVPGHQERPAWSPDGRKLAFAGWDPQDPRARQAIWETDAAGTTPTLVTTDCEPPACAEEWDPSYSADGTRMVFVRSAGPGAGQPTSTVVAIRDLATGAVQELETTRVKDDVGFVDHPSLAPDGRRVAYARILTDADGNATDGSILVVAIDGGKPTALTPDGWEAGDPSWSPDGSRILFGREPTHYWFGGGKGAGENTFIYTMAPDGSDVVQLTDAGTDFDSAGSPMWTAGGSQILFIDAPLAPIGTPDFDVMAPDGSGRASVARFGDCCRWYPVQQPTP